MVKSRVFFITGTDTHIGKTEIAAGLLHWAKLQNLSTAAVKPIAAGCEQTSDGWRNDDAVLLLKECTKDLCYQDVNPIAMLDAIAPHIAAARSGTVLSVENLHQHVQKVLALNADLTLIEGAGGWQVPINNTETMADLAVAIQAPVILVVGLRLGCINHALLTANAIVQSGLPLAGWVANLVDPEFSCVKENIEAIQSRIHVPCIGKVPFIQGVTPGLVAQHVHLNCLIDSIKQKSKN